MEETMVKRKSILVFLTLFITLALMFASISVVSADKGGVPNEKSVNGAAHANEHSAHPQDTEPPSGAPCDTCGCTVTSSGWCEKDSGELCHCDGGDDCGPLHADPATCLPGEPNTCDCLPPPSSPPPW